MGNIYGFVGFQWCIIYVRVSIYIFVDDLQWKKTSECALFLSKLNEKIVTQSF